MQPDNMLSQIAIVPGTVRLETADSARVVLQPTPTDDPNDPLNWSVMRKTLNFVLACFYALMTFVLLDIGPVIWGDLFQELGISYTDLNNSWAIDCAGLALGCIFLYPLANRYGRRPIYILSLIVQLAGSIWFAKMKTNWENLVINFIIGLAGAISETIVQMTVADLFFTHQRASANGAYVLVVTAGTFLAPVAAGFSAASQGWRWIWWWCTILLSINLVAVVFLFEETKYIPALNASFENNSNTLNVNKSHSKVERDNENLAPPSIDVHNYGSGSQVYHRKSYLQRLRLIKKTDTSLLQHMIQPFIILFTFPAVAYTSVMYGANLAWFSVCGTTSSTYLLNEPYNFGSIGVGLFSLSPFIGSVIAFVYSGPLSDWYIVWRSKHNKGVFEPETRLHLALPCIILTPAGLFTYGLGLAHGLPWIFLGIGYGIYGFSFSVICDLSLTYVLDSYQDIIGDALVGVAFVRNGIATAIVFAISPWIEQQGLYAFFATVGGLSAAVASLTIPMVLFGKRARRATASKYRNYALLQPLSRTFPSAMASEIEGQGHLNR